MEFLVILLLMIGVTVVMVAGFVSLSYALGAYLHSREVALAGPGATEPCAQCHAARDWYYTLPPWQKNAVIAWWWLNCLACALKGCR